MRSLRRVRLQAPAARILLLAMAFLWLGERPPQVRASELFPGQDQLAPSLAPPSPTTGGLLGGLLGPGRRREPVVDARVREWIRQGTPGTRRLIIRSNGRTDLLSTLLRLLGGVLRLRLDSIGALVADVTGAGVFSLLASPSVESISLDARVGLTDSGWGTPRPALSAETNVEPSVRELVGLDDRAPQGSGIGVAIIDSGLTASPEFGSRITAFYDFTRGGTPAALVDPYGHGTHVAGLIAANGSTSNGRYAGVAPRARLIGLRVLDDQGQGYTSHVVQAIEFAIDNRYRLGIDVINLSLGHPVYESAATDPLVAAVERASRAGILVVVAGGNAGWRDETASEGFAGILSPGNAPSALTVGAVDTATTVTRGDDRVTAYSSRGPTWYDGGAKPDLVAPGHRLVSVSKPSARLWREYPSLREGQDHLRLSGTSMAAGVASGLAAVAIAAHEASFPRGHPLSPNTLKAVLQATATPLSTLAGLDVETLTSGAGEIDGHGAWALASGIDTARPAGDAWIDQSLVSAAGPRKFGSDRSALIWARALIEGPVLDRSRYAFLTHVPWSSQLSWEADVTVGNDLVQTSSGTWAPNIVWGVGLLESNGQTYTWGNVETSTLRWRDLPAAQPGDQTYTWGNTDLLAGQQP